MKDVIKTARLERGYTQEQIAKLVKVAKQTYLKWENGETEPKATQIQLLAKYLDVSANEICAGVRHKKISLEEFILKTALSNVPSELMTMYTWKMIPNHDDFFEQVNNVSKDEYFGAMAEVGEIEDVLHGKKKV